MGQVDLVLNRVKEQFASYVAAQWEKLCRDAVPFLKIDGITFGPASRWWGNAAKDQQIELDVVAASQDGKHLLLGECKWSDKALDASELFYQLESKAALLPFTKDKTLLFVAFLKHPAKNTQDRKILYPEDILTALKA
jgi:hypothetical protein